MFVSELEAKIKSLAEKLGVAEEKVLAYFHKDADKVLALAEDNVEAAKDHLDGIPVSAPPAPPPVDAPPAADVPAGSSEK